MIRVLTAEGYKIDKNNFAEVLDEIKKDPKLHFPNTDEGREQILNEYKEVSSSHISSTHFFFSCWLKLRQNSMLCLK